VQPDRENVAMTLAQALVRTGDFGKLQQLSMKMYRQFQQQRLTPPCLPSG
jgi:hypothetical protein